MENMVFTAAHPADKNRRIPIYFKPQHRETAQLAHDSLDKISGFITETWDLEIPVDLRVYVMDSMTQLIFHPAPVYRKVLLGLFFPLWYGKVKKIWEYSGGWSLPVGKRRVIGVKPPELWPDPEKNFGVKVFEDAEDSGEKFRWLLCHEAVHAFSYHLRLPMWLNEGIATLSVDLLYQKQTIRPNLIELLEKREEAVEDMNYRKIQSKEKKLLLYHFLRGYFLTRCLHETHGGLLQELLTQRMAHKEINAKVAKALDLPPEDLWAKVDGRLTAYFKNQH